MSTLVEPILSNEPIENLPAPAADSAHTLPAPNRGKAAMFNVFMALAVVLNIACGVLTYAIYSRGEILEDFYDRLVSTDVRMFVWIAAGIGLLGTIVTLVAYVLSFDYRRKARPVVRLWIMWASFAVFLAGLLLGLMNVGADNVPAILGSLVACAVLPLPIILAERAIGRGAVRNADRLLASHSVKAARASARTGLTFTPGNHTGLTAYGKALAATGKPAQALPYLLYVEQHEDPLLPQTALALADAWEETGDHTRASHYLDMLPAEMITPQLQDRRVRLWLELGRPDAALEAMRAMTPGQRKPWHSQYHQLLISRRDRKALHALCAEYKSDEEAPYENTVQCLKDILSLYPSDTEALTDLIEIQRELKQPNAVAALQEELLSLEESRTDVRRSLIDFYWERGNKSELLRHLNRLLLLGQATTDEKVRLLEESYAEGDYLRVIELVEHESDLAQSPRALAILANALYQGGRTDDALARIAEARRLNPDERLAQNLDALSAKIRKSVLDTELTDLQQKTQLSPADLDLKFDYLDRLVAAKAADRVVVELDDLLQARPELLERVEKEIRVMLSRHGKNRRLMDYLGDLYLRHGEYDQAFELYTRRAQGEMAAADILHDASQRILEKKPDHAGALLAEAEYYYNTGDSAQALEYYDRLVATAAPLTDDVKLLELEAAEKAGLHSRALQAAERLLAAKPDDVELLSRAGQIATGLKEYDRAIGHLQKATDLNPDSFDYRRQLRDATETKKRERIAAIKEQLAATPGNRDLMEELGDLYHDFDQLNDAIAAYQRAGINDPQRRVPKAKQGYVLARKGLFTDADEILKEADLRSDLPEEEQDRLKSLFFTTAQLMEQEDELDRALDLYRRIFRVDAGYKHVVSHIERLQLTAKKRNQVQY